METPMINIPINVDKERLLEKPGSVSIKWTHFLRVFLQPIHSRVVS